MKRRLFAHSIILRAALAWGCCSLALASCQDEDIDGGHSAAGNGTLHFTIAESGDGWNQVASKAAGTDTLPSLRVYKMESGNGGELFLTTSVEPGIQSAKAANPAPATKGAALKENEFWETINLDAYLHHSGEPITEPDFFTDMTATRDAAAGAYYLDGTGRYFLPGKGLNVTFFAYAPDERWEGDTKYLTVNKTVANGGHAPSYTLVETHAARNQQDLCIANGVDIDGGGSGEVPLHFKHVLTAIKFKAAADMRPGTITQINLRRVHKSGTYTPAASGNGYGTWVPDAGDGSCQIEDYEGRGYLQVEVGKGSEVNLALDKDGKEVFTFFMIPDDNLEGSSIEIKYTPDGGSEQSYVHNFTSSDSWKPGTTVTYTISNSDDFEITAEQATSSVSPNGGDIRFTVTSSRNGAPQDYRAQFFVNGQWVTASPAMVSNNQKTNNNNGTWTQTITIAPSSPHIENASNQALRNKGERGGTTNLANGNTANCYMVNQAGRYTFPLVYGNGLYQGNTNTDVMGKYPNHNGATITNPYIYNNGVTISRACVLWQDVEGLVTECRLSANNQMLEFYMPLSNIAEGNAVLGVLNPDGVVIWSWHIWVVNTVPGTVQVRSKSGTARNVLTEPLGWVEGGTKTWTAREQKVRFVILEDNSDENSAVLAQTEEFTLLQTGGSSTTIGRYTTYQWGRKDPMLPGAADYNALVTNTPVFPGADGDRTYLPTGGTFSNGTISEWIKNPHRFNTNTSNVRTDLWDANGNTSGGMWRPASVVKSIYDPCPFGYKVPPAEAFDSFVINGEQASALDGINMDRNYSYQGHGFRFNTADGRGIVFPFGGLRFAGSSFRFEYYGQYGYYWTAGKLDNDHGTNLMTSFILQGLPRPFCHVYGNTTGVNSDKTNCYAIMPVQADR